MENDIPRIVQRGEKARKRTVNKENWKRQKEKKLRLKPKGLPKAPVCRHQGVTFRCQDLRGSDVYKFHKNFYESSSKAEQDAFILAYTIIHTTKRTDRRNNGPTKAFRVQHYIRKNNGKLLRVCKTAFCNVLRITDKRVKGVCQRHFRAGTAPKENRGGDRVSAKFTAKRQAVITYISKYKVIEKHYCRSKSSLRQYLPGDLSISRMYRHYNLTASPELQVKSSYFRHVFNTYFNIGFKMPSSDMCSTCIMLKDQIKTEKNQSKKNELLIQLRVHKLRAKTFFEFAREELPGLTTFSFDGQKNMCLPKVPDQAAYYSRQLYLFNFAIVRGSSQSHLRLDNVFLYLWTENIRPKGCNEIASALHQRLCSTIFEGNVNKIRLICDGCGSQNKNQAMVAMISYWLYNQAPAHLNEVQLIYPIPGHSYIPPDRVFAQLEKLVKVKETLLNVEEYYEMYKEYGTLIKLASDQCPVRNWMEASTTNFKPPAQWHFKFSFAKRIIIKRMQNTAITVRGESTYKSDMCVAKTLLRKNKKIETMQLPSIPNEKPKIKPEKLSDVDKLLQKHCGKNWRENNNLVFYKKIIDEDQGNIEYDEEFCQNHDDENILRI